jgi:hypothetical protein
MGQGMTKLSDEQIQKLRELEAEATPLGERCPHKVYLFSKNGDLVVQMRGMGSQGKPDAIPMDDNYEFYYSIRKAAKALLDEIVELRADNAKMKQEKYVPGHWECKKCEFYLVSKILYVQSGSIGSNDSPNQCANGCGPMWRISWTDHVRKVIEGVDALADERNQLRAENAQMKEKLAVAEEELGFYANGANYKEGSGSAPKFGCEFGQVIERSYPAIPGDDSGDLARAAIERVRGQGSC